MLTIVLPITSLIPEQPSEAVLDRSHKAPLIYLKKGVGAVDNQGTFKKNVLI